jgi:hypothetical protein
MPETKVQEKPPKGKCQRPRSKKNRPRANVRDQGSRKTSQWQMPETEVQEKPPKGKCQRPRSKKNRPRANARDQGSRKTAQGQMSETEVEDETVAGRFPKIEVKHKLCYNGNAEYARSIMILGLYNDAASNGEVISRRLK